MRACPECGAPGHRVTTLARHDLLGRPADPNVITCTAGHRYPADPSHPRWRADDPNAPRQTGLVIPRGGTS